MVIRNFILPLISLKGEQLSMHCKTFQPKIYEIVKSEKLTKFFTRFIITIDIHLIGSALWVVPYSSVIRTHISTCPCFIYYLYVLLLLLCIFVTAMYCYCYVFLLLLCIIVTAMYYCYCYVFLCEN